MRPGKRRAFALTLAMGAPGGWNIDQGRAARESLHPAEYLAKSYYEIWIAGLEKMMAERGLVTPDEIEAGKALASPKGRWSASSRPRPVPAVLASGGPTERAAPTPQRFQVGQRVRARNIHPTGHTRLPRYVRGHVWEPSRTYTVPMSFRIANATGRGERPTMAVHGALRRS